MATEPVIGSIVRINTKDCDEKCPTIGCKSEPGHQHYNHRIGQIVGNADDDDIGGIVITCSECHVSIQLNEYVARTAHNFLVWIQGEPRYEKYLYHRKEFEDVWDSFKNMAETALEDAESTISREVQTS